VADRTEPMPAPRDPTEPLPEPRPRTRTRPPTPDGDRRLWIVAGVLALILAFVAGYLVGRGGGQPAQAPVAGTTDAETGPVKRRACLKAVRTARRAQAVQSRALANRAALVQARGDEELVARLNAELETLGQRFDRIEARFERLAERCGG
jgi:hypothetical protein